MRSRVRLGAVVLVALSAVPLALTARVQLPPGIVTTQLQLADILYDTADYRAALGVYLRALRTSEASLRNRARTGAVRASLRLGEFALASVHSASLRRALPADPLALALSGDSYWATGLFEEAEAAYREALSIDPTHGRAHNGLSRSLAALNRLDEALVEAEAAVAAEPRESDFYHTLGQTHERLRRYGAAADAYVRFVERLSPRERQDRGALALTRVSFLRAFGAREPLQIVSPPDAVHQVGFRVVRGKLVVKAKINGDEMDFAVDTGAEQTVITARTARRLGIEPLAETLSAGVGMFGMRGLKLGIASSLRVGTLDVRNVPVLIKDPPLRGLPTPEAEGLSPLALGLSMSVDYQRRRLTMARTLADAPAEFHLPLRMHRLATVRGHVNDRPASFIVDTGGEVISVNTAVARSLFRPADRRRIALKVYGASGWDPEAYLLPGVSLAFEALRYGNTPVVVLNLEVPSVLLGYQIGGIVGHKFLSRYRVDIDLKENVVRLKAIG